MTARHVGVREAVLARLGFSAYDLPTRDKLPLLRQLMGPEDGGLALDVGIGTGYTTYSVFGERPTVCVDVDPANLRYYRRQVLAVPGTRRPLCVVAGADALPFRADVFRLALCSEVLEHLEDDAGAVAELARVLRPGGRLVVTVPYVGLGFTSFLELCRIKTVHDFPGPERHVRPGYDERTLGALLEPRGLAPEQYRFYLQLFTRLATDAVSLAHLAYQRLVHGRRAWTWSAAVEAADTPVFRLYTWIFGALHAFCRLDRLLGGARGFGLVAVARKPVASTRRASVSAAAGAAGDR